MASATLNSKPVQMIVTLEDNALIADIKKALKLLPGVASVRMANLKDDETITPAMHRSINKARREYANGETISCSTPEEMQRYFDNLWSTLLSIPKRLTRHYVSGKNDRIIYDIYDDRVSVLIIQAEEHYNDK